MNEIIKEFYILLTALISLNKQRRLKQGAKVLRNISSPVDYAFNFCTIKCDIGRMTGKTTFIKHYAKGKKALVIVVAKSQRDNFGTQKGLTVVYAAEVKDIEDIKTYPLIFIDEPYYVNKLVSLHQLYQHIASDKIEQTFIQVGR